MTFTFESNRISREKQPQRHAMNKKDVFPIDMRKLEARKIGITWNDGHEGVYTMRLLRAKCPCAECVDEVSGKRMISLDDVPNEITALEARPVGRYAYQFVWSDRHDTGIYTYSYLRSLCECEQCKRE